MGIIEEEISILSINGSPHPKGNTTVLLKAFKVGAESAGGQVEELFLPDFHIQPCIRCQQCSQDKICTQFRDGMHLIYPKVQKAQGLALASPSHNYNLTAWMKAFLDRLNCFFKRIDPESSQWLSRLADRPRNAVVMALGVEPAPAEPALTLPALRRPLEPLGYQVVGDLQTPVYSQAGAVKDDLEIMQQAYFLGTKLVKEAKGPPMTYALS